MPPNGKNRKQTVAYCGYEFCFIKHAIDMHADIITRGGIRKCTAEDCELFNQFNQQIEKANIPPKRYSDYHIKHYLHEDAHCREDLGGGRGKCGKTVPHYRYKYQEYRCDIHNPWANPARMATMTNSTAVPLANSPVADSLADSLANLTVVESPTAGSTVSKFTAGSSTSTTPMSKPPIEIKTIRVPMFDVAWGDESSDESSNDA